MLREIIVKLDTVTKANAKSWTHPMAAKSSSNLEICMQNQLSVSKATHFGWTLLFQQLYQPTTVAHLVWHHCQRKWGHSVSTNRYTQKYYFAFWAFFLRNPGKVGVEGTKRAFLLPYKYSKYTEMFAPFVLLWWQFQSLQRHPVPKFSYISGTLECRAVHESTNQNKILSHPLDIKLTTFCRTEIPKTFWS